jgi:hypothetical protein
MKSETGDLLPQVARSIPVIRCKENQTVATEIPHPDDSGKPEQIGTNTNLLSYRGMSRSSLKLIDAMREIIRPVKPITGRGVGYKLFVKRLIKSMAANDMKRVYRLLKIGREKGYIQWSWIVDETRGEEGIPTWDDPGHFADCMAGQYRRDFWARQPQRCKVWSEKSTVSGLLKPVLDEYGVLFTPVHGFNSATKQHETARDGDSRPLTILYVGDYDPSGIYMSEVDLSKRFKGYGGYHITVKRIALTHEHTSDGVCELLPSFPASDKRKDPRYKWFVENYGKRCWELDAMDPNELRDCVEEHIWSCILDRDQWERDVRQNEAEHESILHGAREWCRALRGT